MAAEERYSGLTYYPAVDLMYTLSPYNNKLYEINPANITKTRVGNLSEGYYANDMVGLTYYPEIYLSPSESTLLSAKIENPDLGAYRTDFVNIDAYVAHVELIDSDYDWLCDSLLYSRQDKKLYGLCRQYYTQYDFSNIKLVRLEHDDYEGGFRVKEEMSTEYSYLSGLAKKPSSNIFFSTRLYGDQRFFVELNNDTDTPTRLGNADQIKVIPNTLLYKDFDVGYQVPD